MNRAERSSENVEDDLEATLLEIAPGLLRYCAMRTACLADAEDLAQNALAVLVGRWRRQRPPANARAFVFAIARRRSWRVAARRRLRAPLESLRHEPVRAPSPEDLAGLRRQVDDLRSQIARLSRAEREVVLLVAAGGLGVGEAAKTLGISPSAAKMRLHRARKKLAEAVSGPALPKENHARASRI